MPARLAPADDEPVDFLRDAGGFVVAPGDVALDLEGLSPFRSVWLREERRAYRVASPRETARQAIRSFIARSDCMRYRLTRLNLGAG